MRIIISSGGTEEPIDSVRKISNFSTGSTGAHLASYFASRGAMVSLIRGQNAVSPMTPEIIEHRYQSHNSLRDILRLQLSGKHWDAIIHLAAVSDYIVERIQVDERDYPIGGHSKIPSGHKVLLYLRPSEKILDSLREWSLNRSIIGFIGGGGLSWGLLAYGGRTPVNLFLALALLVAFPGCLTLISLLLALLPPSKRRYEKLARKFTQLLNFGLGAARRLGFLRRGRSDAIESGMVGFKGHWRNYSTITRWYLSVVLQFRAVFFNLGIFLAILLRGAIQDLAFAWQTSLPLNPVHIHSFAQSLAWPWRHLISPPTLEQVAGSRLILKEGISALANADLLSWWPYIVCASLAYGLLPRLLVLLYCLIRRAIADCTPNFLDERGRNLIAAMESLSLVPSIGGESDLAAELGRLEAVKIHILSPSIRPDLNETEFWKKYLHERWQAELCQLIPVELDDDSDRDAFKQLEDSLKDGEAAMIIFEGWRPYTSSAALYVDALSERLPKGVKLITALAGRPSGERFEQDAEIFTQWSRLLPAATMAKICVIRVLEEFV